MKTLIALLAVVASSLAAEAPYSSAGSKSQAALLLLPLKHEQNNTTNTTSTTPSPQNDGQENLEEVNSRIMEKLRQEQGSEQGVYHVYLQDGRLQRVQYTTAPIRPGQQAQQQQDASSNYNQQQQDATSNYNQQQQDASSNYNQQQQTPEILSPTNADKRGVYFVQVPQERIQAYQAQSQLSFEQNFQNSQAFIPAQYNQEPVNEVNVKYLPLEASSSQGQFGASGLSGQYREEQPVVRYLPIQLTEDNSQPASYSSQYRQQQGEPTEYLASVQYSQVEPIQGPVYSYKSEGLTRILRYAPVF